MDVAFAFLCDYAESGPKLAAMGIGIDTIYASVVPTPHPMFHAVIAIRFSRVELGQKHVGVRLIDADGHDLIPHLDTTLNVEAPGPGYEYRTVRFALGLNGVTFPRYGDYSVRFLVDGHEMASLPLKVAQPPARPATA